MKKLSFLIILTTLLGWVGCDSKQSCESCNLPDSTVVNIDKVDPPYWFVGMKNPSLQIMLYGNGVGKATDVVTHYAGVQVDSVVHLDSPNYLLVYLKHPALILTAGTLFLHRISKDISIFLFHPTPHAANLFPTKRT